MSSILRALKKLENDPRHLDETGPLDTQFVPLADTDQQKKASNILLPVLGAGLVCGLVILAGWWFFAEKIMPPAPLQQSSQQQLPHQELTTEAPGDPTTPAGTSDALAPVKPAPTKTVPAASTSQGAGIVAGKNALPSRPATGQVKDAAAAEEMTGRMFGATGPEMAGPAPVAEIGATGSRAPEPSARTMEVVIPLLSDPDMKLQAITWSKNPQKRIAVINNRILHQGDVVAGYRLDNINQDDVELSAGGEKWKLLFRIK